MDLDLTGRRALVSGSSQGIGLAIATELARAGAEVVVNGRREDKTARAVAAIRQEIHDAGVAGVTGVTGVTGVAADLASAEGADELFAKVDVVDILVNNLGIYGAKPVFEIDDDEWRRYFEVNVLSAVRLIRHYLPGMMERGFGRVMSIASEAAVATPPHMVHLGVTKTALLAVTRGFAKAAAGTGVTVNSVLAGPTRGPDSEELDDPKSLIRRLVEPAEIGQMIVYLSSTQAAATTGGAIRVDGGYIDSILP